MKRGGDNNALPPAKRNRADAGADGQGEDGGKGIDEDELTQFQKQAIWRRMQEYKREAERANEQIGEFEKLRGDYEKRSSLFCSSLAMISEDISLTLGKLDGRLQSNGTAGSLQILDILKSFEESNEPRLDGLRRTLADQLSTIRKLRTPLLSYIRTPRCKLITSQLQKLSELEEKLDDVRGARIVLERKLDRAKASVASGKDSSVDIMNDDSTAITLAAMRIKEIEELKLERMDLLEKMDAIRLQSIQTGITEDRIRESPLYQNLEAEFQYHRNENMCLKNRIDKLLIEYEELVSDRRKISEGGAWKREKIISGPDQHAAGGFKIGMLELRRAKDEADIVHNQEIRMIANSRKDRIAFLERRLEILKEKAASGNAWHFLDRVF
ncbi:hypothetical protein BC829DRAFT_431865 [Chytridium lagenaria]|nr:hypothetical protein BC829DRAFT_431865 [Chytridium lagenaria]